MTEKLRQTEGKAEKGRSEHRERDLQGTRDHQADEDVLNYSRYVCKNITDGVQVVTAGKSVHAAAGVRTYFHPTAHVPVSHMMGDVFVDESCIC